MKPHTYLQYSHVPRSPFVLAGNHHMCRVPRDGDARIGVMMVEDWIQSRNEENVLDLKKLPKRKLIVLSCGGFGEELESHFTCRMP